jgi:hypothetical protein
MGGGGGSSHNQERKKESKQTSKQASLIAKNFYAVKILVFYTIRRAAARGVSSRLEIFFSFLTITFFTFLSKEQL